MKYIRTYETKEKFLTDKDSTSRGFRLKPTLYKYSEAGDHVHLENDDPRKHEGSTYMEITLDSDVEFSFYIGNKSGDTQTTMNCSIDWGDGTVETKTITEEIMTDDYKGFKLSHNYKAGSYKIELYGVERDYSVVGDIKNWKSLISHPSSVKRVILGGGVVSIWKYVFRDCTSLTSIHIPERVTIISMSAFWDCKSLTSINIPEGVTKIRNGAFKNCTSLTSINIPEGVTSMEDSAFNHCTSLKSIHIPESVTSIRACTFNHCTSLKSIHIPESVTSIESQAFEYCTSLVSISSLNTTAPTLSNYRVFNNIPTNGTLHIKPGATGYNAWLSALPSGWTIVEDL